MGKRGLFIALYGVNNIGKSTHRRILAERLRASGHEVVSIKYPIYDLDPTGKQINEIIRGGKGQEISEEALQALFTQNRKDFEPTLQKYLSEDKIVIAEDYIGTGIAWGMAKGLHLEFMEKLNEGLLKEDFAILLTGNRDVRASEKKHIHEQNLDLLQNVSKIFIELGERYAWSTIRIQKTIPETAELVWGNVQTFIAKNQ